MVQQQITKNKKTISYLYATTWNQNKNQQICQLWRWQADSSDKVRRPIPLELGCLYDATCLYGLIESLYNTDKSVYLASLCSAVVHLIPSEKHRADVVLSSALPIGMTVRWDADVDVDAQPCNRAKVTQKRRDCGVLKSIRCRWRRSYISTPSTKIYYEASCCHRGAGFYFIGYVFGCFVMKLKKMT